MWKFTLLFFVVLLGKNVQAQYLSFIQNGKVWQKTCHYGRGGTSGCIYHLGCPTLINGKEYYPYYNGKKLKGYSTLMVLYPETAIEWLK